MDQNHTSKEFHDKLKELTKKAEELGVYNSKIPMVDLYCGIKMKN